MQHHSIAPDALERIRSDFPELAEEVQGHALAYLDSGATALRPTPVLDVERTFAETRTAAVHRGAHTLAALATVAYEDARERVAAFVGADADEISWTFNATDALNTVSIALARAQRSPHEALVDLGPGDVIVTTEAEHHANLLPWQDLAAVTGATLRIVPVDDDGVWTAEAAVAAIDERTRVVAFAHVGNVTGLVAPVAEVVAAARAVGAITVLDACQSAPHMPLDLHAIDVDAAAFSAHKMLGAGGIGVLYLRRELGLALPPARTGGSMITTVTLEGAEWMPPPQRFEAGTQPVNQAVGLAAAADYLDAVGRDAIAAHEHALGQRLVDGLATIDGIRIVGPQPGQERAGVASIVVDGVHAHDVGQVLDAQGIAVRVGHHCAQPLHRRLGVAATTRASTYLYTTEAEVDRFLDAVSGVRGYFGVGR